MSSVGWSKSLSHENMSQVTATVCALNLGTMTVWIWQVINRSFHFFVKSRPTAVGIEFID